METKVININDIDLIEGLEKGEIIIADFEAKDDELIFWFYSDKDIDGLDDIEKSIEIDKIIEKLEENYSKVITYNGRFYSLSNISYWTDHNDNYEEDADQEIISDREILDAIYEIFLDKRNIAINYNINVSVPISLRIEDLHMSLADWNSQTEEQKSQFIINYFNDHIGIQNYNVSRL